MIALSRDDAFFGKLRVMGNPMRSRAFFFM